MLPCDACGVLGRLRRYLGSGIVMSPPRNWAGTVGSAVYGLTATGESRSKARAKRRKERMANDGALTELDYPDQRRLTAHTHRPIVQSCNAVATNKSLFISPLPLGCAGLCDIASDSLSHDFWEAPFSTPSTLSSRIRGSNSVSSTPYRTALRNRTTHKHGRVIITTLVFGLDQERDSDSYPGPCKCPAWCSERHKPRAGVSNGLITDSAGFRITLERPPFSTDSR